MQNLPNHGNPLAKVVKSCVEAPEGWVLVGIDYPSLEDRISAKQTNDPIKRAVYLDGYDGHCLRANAYFNLGRDTNDVEAINSIKKDLPAQRDASKPITFALTYLGTYHTLMNNLGMPKEDAIEAEENFKALYKVSIDWAANKLQEAADKGYLEVAFGHRIRCPQLLGKDMSRDLPTFYEELRRTLSNALGQSYGMLNSRSGVELRQRLKASPFNADIIPVAHIHDAQYFLVRNDPAVIQWLNTNVVECNLWEDLDEIRSPEIPLGGDLEIFYPNWATGHELENNATLEEISNAMSDIFPQA